MKKLRNRRGETLLETLVATLIFTFGSIILLTMISAAVKINDAAQRADDKFYRDMAIVEKAEFSQELEQQPILVLNQGGYQQHPHYNIARIDRENLIVLDRSRAS